MVVKALFEVVILNEAPHTAFTFSGLAHHFMTLLSKQIGKTSNLNRTLIILLVVYG